MKIFTKRMAYRVGGGAVTILLGVLAAAGAQRQGVQVDDLPPALTAPEWANSPPLPIASSSAAAFPVSDFDPSEPLSNDGPSYGGFQLPGNGPTQIQRVGYDDSPASPIAAASPAAASTAPVNDLRGALPPAAMGYADGPASFGLPPTDAPYPATPSHSDPLHQDGPAMADVSMQLPTSGTPSLGMPPVAMPAAAMPPVAMPEIDMDAIAMREMPELPMDAPPEPMRMAPPTSPPISLPPTPPAMQVQRDLPPLPVPQNPSLYSQNTSPATFAPIGSAIAAQTAAYASGPGSPNNRTPNNDPSMGPAEPGDRRLEGMQSPSIVIQKRGPNEVKIGQPATFVVHVQNVGNVEATNVQILDRIPAGMQLIDAAPQPTMQGDQLVWQLGSLPPGDERSITMQLVPHEEGELGSVARVTFEAAASVRTRSTRPELKIVQQVRPDVLIGQQLEIDLQVSNVGTGEATGVILQVDVPEGLDHPRGRQLDNALGSLRPGETRREILRLRAVAPGVVENTVRLISDDAETVAHTATIEVTSPQLSVELTGPNRRYLERQATYAVNLENRGTAAASNVELVAFLDRGFTFVSTENEGTYDPNRHAVLWSLPNLPAGAAGSVPLTLLAVQQGEQAIRLEAAADLNMRAQSSSSVMVESKAELTFSIADTADPIELGGETAYEIRVQNNGSRDDTNVQVQMKLPPGLELIRTDADAESDGRGGVLFKPKAQMPAGTELIYRVAVRGTQPDMHLVSVIVTSDQSRVPVSKQESTEVYADQ